MNVGILFPASTAHPNVGLDFMNGLRAYINEQNIGGQINFFSESIGIGGSEKEVYAKAEKLVTIDDVDVLLAYVDERVLEMLNPLLYAAGKLMIVINPGANYPVNWVPQENIVYLTLQHAFCCWQSGSLAAQQNNRAGTVSTFYDCGYLHSTAMINSFVNNDGTILYNYINNDLYNETFSIVPLVGFMEANGPGQTLLCAFDDLPASLLYGLLQKDNAGEDAYIAASPMMLEAKALANVGAGFAFSIGGYTPWMADAPHAGNATFSNGYTKKSKTPPTFFSVLGWEAGMLLERALQKGGADITDGAALVAALQSAPFESPRGNLRLDPETHHFLAAIGKCSLPAGAAKLETAWSDDYEKDWKAFTEQPTTGAVSGWTNTYLCY